MMRRKYVNIFHANLNYAFLEPHKYEEVIRASYEMIIDTHCKKFPEAKFVFEASGYTIDQMGQLTPDVLKKLVRACESGQCEFMGAPYAHPVMSFIPEEDGRWSNYFSMKTYEKHLGFRPVSFWNPELTWRQYVPKAFRDAGVKNPILDFEAYMCSNDKDHAWIERNRTRDMIYGGNLVRAKLDPDCKFMHLPFHDVVPGLNGFCRSDRLVSKYVRYFRDLVPLDELLEDIQTWSGTQNKGATILIADDAEYCGTTGYYYVKHHGDYSRIFNLDPEAPRKLENLIGGILELGDLVQFRDACEMDPVEEPYYVEDGFAWHRTCADAWNNTPEAQTYDPILAAIGKDYKENVQPVAEAHEELRGMVEKFWFHMANSANSDGRWPAPPLKTCPFNRQWVETEIERTKTALAALKEATKKYPSVENAAESPRADDGVYGYQYTEKDTSDLKKLNMYELQHHWCAVLKEYAIPEKKEIARQELGNIYSEFQRRGFDNMDIPSFLIEEPVARQESDAVLVA